MLCYNLDLSMKLSNDKRKVDGMQVLEKFVFPAVIAAGSAFLSIQITLSSITLDVDYIKRDVDRQAVSLAKVTQLQLDVIALQIEVKNANASMVALTKDVERLRDRLRALENEIPIHIQGL